MVDYIEKINDISIGGYQFDGTRDDTITTLNNGSTFTMAAGATRTFDVSSLIPNDGYDYFCTFDGYLYTGTSSGNSADMQIYSGSSASNPNSNFYRRLCRAVTRHSSAQFAAGTIEILIRHTDKKITIYNGDSNGTSGNMQFRLTSYRRVGTNDSLANKVEKITTKDGTYTLGGKVVDGNLKLIMQNAVTGTTVAASGTSNISIANLLPNDGYEYEVFVTIYSNTPSTSGKSNILFVNNKRCAAVISRSASAYRCGGNALIKVGTNRNIAIYNSGNSVTNSTSLRILHAKRLGTNNPTNTISNITTPDGTYNIGGNGFYGSWVSKYLVAWTGTYAADGSKTISVSNYLPDNIYTYEVLVAGFGRTGSSAGNGANLWVRGNVGTSTILYSYIVTRTASTYADAKSGIILCKQGSDNKFNIYTDQSSSQASGNCGILLCGYRRVGTNGG